MNVKRHNLICFDLIKSLGIGSAPIDLSSHFHRIVICQCSTFMVVLSFNADQKVQRKALIYSLLIYQKI